MRLVLFGVSSPYAAEAAESAQRAGVEVAACVRNRPDIPVPAELNRLTDVESLTVELRMLPFLVPLIGPAFRHQATEEALGNGFTAPGILIDPTAAVASSAALGAGSYVNTRAIIAAGVRAGDACSLNRGASIGHHCVLDGYVTVGPGAVTGGSCRIGHGAFIGVGAVVAPKITIGPNAVVGAGAVVVDDVASETVVVGNPARVIGHGPGYGGAGVPATAVSVLP